MMYTSDDCHNGGDTHRADARVDELFALLYGQLKRQARYQLRRMPVGQTLQPTVLVHEVYERLARYEQQDWESHSHFIAVARKVMKGILIDAIRRKHCVKRGGNMVRVTMTEQQQVEPPGMDDVSALMHALDELEREYPDEAYLVLLRFVGGFTMEQIAERVGVPKRTLERRWKFAQAWLRVQLAA